MNADAGRDSARLFFSLWPTDELRERIAATTLAAARDSGGRSISPRNFHVTLVFLGEVERARVSIVQQAAASVSGAARFALEFDRLEAWPRSNVLCLTTSQIPAAAAHLAGELQRRLQQPFSLRSPAFRPHVTLARDLPRVGPIQARDPLRWQADEFVLVESKRGGDGSNYSVIDRWPL